MPLSYVSKRSGMNIWESSSETLKMCEDSSDEENILSPPYVQIPIQPAWVSPIWSVVYHGEWSWSPLINDQNKPFLKYNNPNRTFIAQSNGSWNLLGMKDSRLGS